MPKTQSMTIEKYLRTSFEGADCEFLDGQVVERNAGDALHAAVLGAIFYLIRCSHAKLLVLPVIRSRVTLTRVRIPDVAAWLGGHEVFDPIPNVPPFLAIEVYSPDDRMPRMREKIAEYLRWGVAFVWLIHPRKRAAWCYTSDTPEGVAADKVLSTSDPAIDVVLDTLFASLPKPAKSERKR